MANEFRAKILDIDAEGRIVILNQEDAERLGIMPADRVILSRNEKKSAAVIDTTQDLVSIGEIGLLDDIQRDMNLKTGDTVHLSPAQKPESILLIKKKMEKGELTSEEINTLVMEIAENKISMEELYAFVTAAYINGYSLREIIDLTKAIYKYSGQIVWKDKEILDKHCIGGIPGNRVGPIVVSIVAAAGYKIPKTSTRAITSPAGTADVMECFCDVNIPINEMKKIVEKTNGCLVWYGGLNVKSIDEKMIDVEYEFSIDPEGHVISSVLAKKKSSGSNIIIIDIPWGKTAKIETNVKAWELGEKFVKVGSALGMKIGIILTEGTQPIGNGIGPALEAKDVLSVLNGQGPLDLKEKSILVAGKLFELAGRENGIQKAREILESGLALKKFKEIVKAQNGDPEIKVSDIRIGIFRSDILSKKGGKIVEIDNKKISKVARLAGAPTDKAAGLYIYKKLGDLVEKGEKIATLYSDYEWKLKEAKKFSEKDGIFKIK